MTDTVPSAAGELQVSERFNAKDADVIFQSSDGVLFRIHSFNLKACTEGFSPPECSTFEEVVQLTETVSTLELLFRFIYPIPQPDLTLLQFEDLEALAEAVEKYQVFPAMDICKLHMKNILPNHVESVLAYAMKHGYIDVLAKVFPLILAMPVEESAAMMASDYILPWIKYYGAWSGVASAAIIALLSRRPPDHCGGCQKKLDISKIYAIMTKLGEGPRSLQDLDSVFGPSCCTDEGNQVWALRLSVESQIKAIPDLAELIPLHKEKERQRTKFSEPWAGSDIVLVSSDGQQFHVHRLNLETFTSGLTSSIVDDIISSTENASTLDLLFQFIYPMRRPELESLDFDTLASLALAAEQYKVYSAMTICRMHMTYALPNHPSAVMGYAAMNKFYDMMNTAAPLLVECPLEESLKLMTSSLVIPWVRYYEQWNGIARSAAQFGSKLKKVVVSSEDYVTGNHYTFTGCLGCRRGVEDSTIKILCKLSQGAKVICNLDDIFDPATACCNTGKKDLYAWRRSVEEDIRAIPDFDTFISP